MGTDWKRFLRSVACCFVPVMGLVVGIQEYASAQGVSGFLGSFFPVPIVGSFEPVTSFEKFCGPLLPKCDIGNTFRSEVGVGYKWASTGPALLTGPNWVADNSIYALGRSWIRRRHILRLSRTYDYGGWVFAPLIPILITGASTASSANCNGMGRDSV